MSYRRFGLLLPILLAVACGQNEPEPPPFPTDPAGSFFARDEILDVRIEMSPADWDELRGQTRDWWDIVAAPGRNCLAQPFRKPFTYFPADVTVDGILRENVGVRQKGFLGSIDDQKPALKVKFNEYDPEQRLYGLSRLTLNNSKQDPSYIKQCLSYDLFARAGIPSPRCNFARVAVNGQDMGLYVHVEHMGQDFLRRNFEEDSGDLWEGELSDFRYDWYRTFEKKTNVEPGEDQAQVNRRRLLDLEGALNEQASDAQMLSDVSEMVDVESFLTFWALETILEHWDGYANNANNFFIYDNPEDSRIVFMPWGTDQVMMTDPFDDEVLPPTFYTAGVLARRLYVYPETYDRFERRLRELLDGIWHEEALLADVDRLQALSQPVLEASGADVASAREAVETVRDFIRNRRGVILADLASGPYSADLRPLPRIPCVNLVGHLEGTFSTVYGSHRPDYPASFGGDLGRGPLRIVWAGSYSNLDQGADAWPVVRVEAVDNTGLVYITWMGVNPHLFGPDSSAAFGTDEAWGGVGTWNNATGTWANLGGYVRGGIELDQASPLDGAPVSGRFYTSVVEW